MRRSFTKDNRGFTIIEVLIVLAIVGLIMVIVFLAVPALQRNARNTSLNTDANNTLSAVGEYVSNNGGNLPTTVTGFTAGGSSATLDVTPSSGNPVQVKLGGNVSALTRVATGSLTTASSVGAMQVVTGTNGVCNPTGTGMGVAGTGGTRSYAILYVAEGANGSKILKCVGS